MLQRQVLWLHDNLILYDAAVIAGYFYSLFFLIGVKIRVGLNCLNENGVRGNN